MKIWLTRACVVGMIVITLSLLSHSDSSLREEQQSDVTTTLVPGFRHGKGEARSTDLFKVPTLLHSWNDLRLLGAASVNPASTKTNHRLVFIGDIHGCIDELNALLTKIDYDDTRDHIITTGDMVNKGPESGAVLELLRSLKASCVRGNHDDKILRIRAEEENLSPPHEAAKESAVALSLSSRQIDYLSSCPVILHLGEFDDRDLVVVHAGLVPSVPLDRQVAHDVMNMRVIDVETHQPSSKHDAEGAVHWFKLWNRYQTMSAAERYAFAHRQHNVDLSIKTVIYGHDAKKGLQLHKYTKGLDSKCVAGGRLTALVLSHDQGEQIFQVDCQGYVK